MVSLMNRAIFREGRPAPEDAEFPSKGIRQCSIAAMKL